MSLLTAMCCTKCKEILNSADAIFGTSCGHLYHFNCLRECHAKSDKCSHCESYKPCIFKMFLEFENVTQSWENQMKTIELYNELEQSNNKISFLDEKYKIAQVSVQKLEGKLKVVSDALRNKDFIVANLEDRLQELEILNKFMNKEKDFMVKNFGKSEKSSDEKCSTSENKTKREEIGNNILEAKKNKKLKSWNNINIENENYKGNHFNSKKNNNYTFIKNDTLDLKKSSSAEISNENHKESDSVYSKEIYSTEITKNSKENYNKNIGLDSQEIVNQTEDVGNRNENNYESVKSEQNLTNNKEHSENPLSVVIDNYPLKYLEKWTAKDAAIYVASKMRIHLSASDIVRVIVIKNSLKSASIVIIFENARFKQKFLSGKKYLKNFSNLKVLAIR